MSGHVPVLPMLVAAIVFVPLGVVLRNWYAKDTARSLLVLCVMLLLISPWLALAALVLVKSPALFGAIRELKATEDG